MKNNTTQVNAHTSTPQSALSAAVQTVYKAFATYKTPTDLLDVCIACCMDAEVEREMRHLPLRQLTAEHFYEYNSSAKSTIQPTDEIKYFAPRLLELLVEGACLHISTELYLERLGRCGPGAFSATERAALQDFALAYFAAGLEQWETGSSAPFCSESAFTILLMWDYADVQLAPLLNHWLSCESDASTLHFVDASYWDYVLSSNRISNAFASDRPHYLQTMEQWLTDPSTKARWAEKIMHLVDPGPTNGWLPPGVHGNRRHPLHERISAVFDAMTG